MREVETARLGDHWGVTSLAALPDGRVVSGYVDGTIRLWDVALKREMAALQGHTDWVQGLAVLADGSLVSGGRDCTVRVWDLGARAETARLTLDASVNAVVAVSNHTILVGDDLGRIHTLEVVGGGDVRTNASEYFRTRQGLEENGHA
jgi:WD40 repeat protein